MNFSLKFIYSTHSHRFSFLVLLLLCLFTDVSHVAAAASSLVQEQPIDHRQDAEARQFGGFNANVAFNRGTLNIGGGIGVGSGFSTSTATPFSFNVPTYYTTTHNPNANSNLHALNNFNSLNNNIAKEAEKHKYNDKNTKALYIDRFDHHYPDGSYEYRYELNDGTARYERGYFLLYDNKKTLVVVGYYAYRMSDGRYITVFYNADQNGYRQNHSITPKGYPNLPRTIDVPQYKSKDTNAIDDDDDGYYSNTKTTSSPRLTTVTPRRAG